MWRGHRISTSRKEKAGSRLVFSLIEPNWPLPYSTLPVPGLRDARPAGWVTYCIICASTMEEPKTEQQRFKYIVKTSNISDLGIIYLWTRVKTRSRMMDGGGCSAYFWSRCSRGYQRGSHHYKKDLYRRGRRCYRGDFLVCQNVTFPVKYALFYFNDTGSRSE